VATTALLQYRPASALPSHPPVDPLLTTTPESPFPHAWNKGRRTFNNADYFGVELLECSFRSRFLDRSHLNISGVVDEDVNRKSEVASKLRWIMILQPLVTGGDDPTSQWNENSDI